MAIKRPQKPGVSLAPNDPSDNPPLPPKPRQQREAVRDRRAEKNNIKEDLRRRIEIELYKLNQDVIIQRMGVRDELFGDDDDLTDLRKSMEKYELERLEKIEKESGKNNSKTSKKDRPKMDIKLKLLSREKQGDQNDTCNSRNRGRGKK